MILPLANALTDKSSTFIIPERHGYSVKFSSVNPNLLIVATSQKYGRKGGGTLFLLAYNNELICLRSYQWTDGLFDAVWGNGNTDLVYSASGDGSIQLWNTIDDSSTSATMCYKEHSQEASSVDCSKNDEGIFISSSWDCTVKLWDTLYAKSLSTYHEHSQLVYHTKFSPYLSKTFASVSGDGNLKIWNTNCSSSMITVKTHSPEVLTCDWHQTDPNIVATGGSEGFIKLWDIRYASIPILEVFSGHTAIRRIRYSYHNSNVLASVSYDGLTRIWDLDRPIEPIEIIQNHTDSVFGVDWNPFRKNQIVDCGWDCFVQVCHPTVRQNMPLNSMKTHLIQNELNHQPMNMFGIPTTKQNVVPNYIMCGFFWAALLAVAFLSYINLSYSGSQDFVFGKNTWRYLVGGFLIILILVACLLFLCKGRKKSVENVCVRPSCPDAGSANVDNLSSSNAEIKESPPPYEWAIFMPTTCPRSSDILPHYYGNKHLV